MKCSVGCGCGVAMDELKLLTKSPALLATAGLLKGCIGRGMSNSVASAEEEYDKEAKSQRGVSRKHFQ